MVTGIDRPPPGTISLGVSICGYGDIEHNNLHKILVD
jgi:hypothetical protein